MHLRGYSSGKESGMSLLEALVGLAVLGIMLGLATAGFTNRAPKYQLLKTVRELHSRLNYARYRAVYSGSKVRLVFKTQSYRVETWDKNQGQWIKGQEFPLSSSGIDNRPPDDPAAIDRLCRVARSYIARRAHHAFSRRSAGDTTIHSHA